LLHFRFVGRLCGLRRDGLRLCGSGDDSERRGNNKL
jgi:hypothetical protein